MKKQGNLTEGPIFKVLTKLALPIMLSAFLSTAYSLTDMAWIGKLGSKAVTGVGAGGMFVWLSGGFASLTRMGGQVYVGQCMGRGDRESARSYAQTALRLTIVFGVFFGLVTMFFYKHMVRFFALTDPLSISYANIYTLITCGLILFSYLNMVLTGLYTAQGDSATPLKANFIGLVCNMILDPLFIFGFGPIPRMEVAGAAIATVLAQILVLVMFFNSILQSQENTNILKEVSLFSPINSQKARDVIRMGTPTALQGTLYCLISMGMSRMVSGFGEAGIAAQRVGSQIEGICWNIADGFGAALNAFTAQNYGANKMVRVKKGYRMSAFTMGFWGSFVMLVFWLFPRQISELFFYEADVIAISIRYLMILALGEPLMCVEIIAVGAISGLGKTKLCSIISITLTGLRLPLAYILSQTALGLDGIWWAFTLTSIAKGIVFHCAFEKEVKKL